MIVRAAERRDAGHRGEQEPPVQLYYRNVHLPTDPQERVGRLMASGAQGGCHAQPKGHDTVHLARRPGPQHVGCAHCRHPVEESLGELAGSESNHLERYGGAGFERAKHAQR